MERIAKSLQHPVTRPSPLRSVPGKVLIHVLLDRLQPLQPTSTATVWIQRSAIHHELGARVTGRASTSFLETANCCLHLHQSTIWLDKPFSPVKSVRVERRLVISTYMPSICTGEHHQVFPGAGNNWWCSLHIREHHTHKHTPALTSIYTHTQRKRWAISKAKIWTAHFPKTEMS